jgi:opacity protein-like surface antigen
MEEIMRKNFIMACLVLSAFSIGAKAEGLNNYFGIKYYPSVQTKYTNELYGYNSYLGYIISDSESGKGKGEIFSLVAGLKLPDTGSAYIHPRWEAEFMFLNVDEDDGCLDGFTCKNDEIGLITMANLYADFQTGSPNVVPYIGFGAGFIQYYINDTMKPAGYLSIIDYDFSYAFSFMAGALIKVSDAFDIDIGIKHIKFGDTEYEAGGIFGEGLTYEINASSLTSLYVGASYKY